MANDHALIAMPEEVLVMIFKEYFADEILRITHMRLILPDLQETSLRDTIFEKETFKKELPNCMNVFFVCKAFYRIGLSQLYNTATFLWTSSSSSKKRSLVGGLNTYTINTVKRIRNLCFEKLPIGAFKMRPNLKPKFKLLTQLRTLKHETKLSIRSNGTILPEILR